MNAQHRYQPSRRTVVRAAAWTAPAVSIAVAAPAFAAASPGVVQGSATVTGGRRAAKDLYPKFVLMAAASPLTNITVVVTISPGEVDPAWGDVNKGWKRTATTATSASYSYTGQVAPGQGIRFEPYIRLASNDPEVVQVTATFSWTGGSTVAGMSLHK